MNVRRVSIAAIAASIGGALAAVALSEPGPRATIYAATSLREVFPQIDDRQTFQFAGSDTLRAQIERGAPAALLAAASPAEPATLHRQGKCGRPVTFATNSLVMIVPARNPAALRSAGDLRHGTAKRISVGAPGVPIGDHTRRLLVRMQLSDVLTRNTVSNETDVGGVVSKVQSGAADAGFVYATDRKIAGARVRAIPLPARAQPAIRYDLCIVRHSGTDVRTAQAFADEVRSARGRALLEEAGFGVPELSGTPAQ